MAFERDLKGNDRVLSLEEVIRDRQTLQQRWSALGYFPDKSLSQMLIEGAGRYPDVTSVYYVNGQPRTTTNLELYRDGLRLAGALHELGLGRGDVIALQLPTWYETTVFYHAVFHIGAIRAADNPHLWPCGGRSRTGPRQLPAGRLVQDRRHRPGRS